MGGIILAMHDTREQWRPVPGAEGVYSVSDHGAVWTHERTDTCGRRIRGRRLDQGEKDGYPTVKLTIAGRRAKHPVHRLVLLAFVGPCPDGMEACHANDDRTDCRLTNLRWDTRSGNAADRLRNSGWHELRGEDNPNSRLTAAEVAEVRTLLGTLRQVDIARRFGISQGAVSHIATGTT